MGVFKSSNPKKWVSWVSPPFPAIVPHLGFHLFFQKYFSLANVSRKQFGRLLCIFGLLRLCEVGRPALFLWLALPSASCFHKACMQVGPGVLDLLSCTDASPVLM